MYLTNVFNFYNDFQSTFEELLLKDEFFNIYHENIQRLLIGIHKVLHNIPTNTYGKFEI